MMNRDSWVHSYLIVRDEILGFVKDDLLRRQMPRMFSLIRKKVRGSKKIRYRRSLDHKPRRPEIPSFMLGCVPFYQDGVSGFEHVGAP